MSNACLLAAGAVSCALVHISVQLGVLDRTRFLLLHLLDLDVSRSFLTEQRFSSLLAAVDKRAGACMPACQRRLAAASAHFGKHGGIRCSVFIFAFFPWRWFQVPHRKRGELSLKF